MVNFTRQLLRSARDVLLATSLPLVLRLKHQPTLTVLMYHRVLPADHEELATLQPGMYVTPATLQMHIRELRRRGFEIVHLEDGIDAIASGHAAWKKAAAITFDDGWRDNFEYAFPVLRHEKAPASIFLVSDLVGTTGQFWPELMVKWLRQASAVDRDKAPDWLKVAIGQVVAPSSGPLTLDQANEVVERCKSRSDEELGATCTALVSGYAASTDSRRLVLDWEEIEIMRSSGLVRLGSHTRTHKRLGSLDDRQQLACEVAGSRAVLEKFLGIPVTTFCYPNGDYSDSAVAMVRESYAAAVTTRRGLCLQKTDRHMIPRIGMHEDASRTPAAFLARLAMAALQT